MQIFQFLIIGELFLVVINQNKILLNLGHGIVSICVSIDNDAQDSQ